MPTEIEEVADNLHATAIHLLRRVRAVDAATGLNAARLSTLSYLVFAGPATVGELARSEQVTAASVSQLVNGMEREGLVERVADPNDRRVTMVCATKRAEEIMQQGRRARVKLLTSLLSALDPSELETVTHSTELVDRCLRG